MILNPKLQDLLAKFAEPTQFESQLSYEAVYALVKAYQNNPTNIQAGLKSLRYSGISGDVDFTKSNFGNNSKTALFRIEGGEVLEVN